MPSSALSKKLKLKDGAKALLLNAPDGYAAELQPLPDGASLTSKGRGPFDFAQVFARTRAELATLAPQAAAVLAPQAILWLCFPKGSSKIQTDLTRDAGWDVIASLDLKYVTLVSVNDTWSAFALRPYQPGEAKTELNRIAARSLRAG